MLGLTSAVQSLLNRFTASQPALQQKDQPYATSPLPLGDLLNSALQKPTVVKATYAVTTASGAVGAHALSVTLPLGAKVTRLWTDTTTALASGGSATVALSAGATALVTATAYNDASLVGFEAHSVTPAKLAVASQLTVTVAVAALTAGSLDVYVEYIA